MMIPLRRAFIVKQHGSLPYPEGTACAKILIAGEQGGASAKTVFAGFGLAFVYQVLMEACKLWSKEPARLIGGISGYKKAVFSGEASPTLLGVGYIIGTRTSCVMVGGGILAALVLTPAIAFFGEGYSQPLAPAVGKLIRDMGPDEIRSTYVRYIGAGAVAAGGIISMATALPLIASSMIGGIRSMRGGAGAVRAGRTQWDMPIAVVALGSLALVGSIASSHLIPTGPLGRVVGALMILLFGFLFVTVSSRLTGEIGSSSNPISGMTIATLLLTCLIFYLLGWVGLEYRVTALSIAAIVCIASSNGGTTSQDLKTGYLVGATPRAQQWAILVGAITSALVIGVTLRLLNQVYTDVTADPQYLPKAAASAAELASAATQTGPDGKAYKVWWVSKPIEGAQPGKYLVDDAGKAHYRVDPGINGIVKTRADGSPATKFTPPQPALFAVIIDGILTGELPWVLVMLGACLAIVMWLAGVSPLAFAVGVYLPLSTTTPIFVGGMVRGLVDRFHKMTPEESDSSPAVLMSSGLIAGGSMAGILLALLAVLPLSKSFYSTDDLPAARADVAKLTESQKGPDGQTYRAWTAPASAGEPGTYLVDAEGRARFRVEVSTIFDLSRRLGFPHDWDRRPVPALIVFGAMVACLAWVGLRQATVTPAPAGTEST
jgi:uncharacterized oligopeptide transporter (OPT) family protein